MPSIVFLRRLLSDLCIGCICPPTRSVEVLFLFLYSSHFLPPPSSVSAQYLANCSVLWRSLVRTSAVRQLHSSFFDLCCPQSFRIEQHHDQTIIFHPVPAGLPSIPDWPPPLLYSPFPAPAIPPRRPSASPGAGYPCIY